MASAVTEAEIFFFDLHLSLRPLIGGVEPTAELAFLLDTEAYAGAFTGAPLTTPRFTVHALRREVKRNHFWRRYCEAWAPTATGNQLADKLWDLQLPFRLRPRAIDLRPSPELGTGLEVDAELLLWPSGWSSQLELSLDGPLGLDEVRGRIAELSSAAPFLLDGEPTGISGVFERLASDLKEDLFGHRHGVGDRRVLDRYRVVALTRAATPLPPFDPDSMPDDDRAQILGLLLGREVPLPELGQREQEKKYLLSKLRGSDYALTDFDRRSTLLDLTGAAGTGRSRPSLRCLAANVRTCLLVSEALLRLIKEAEKPYAAAGERVARLAETAASVLSELPDLYRNPFSTGLFLNRAALEAHL